MTSHWIIRSRIFQGYDDALSNGRWQPTSGEVSWNGLNSIVSAQAVGLNSQRVWMRLGPGDGTFVSAGAHHVGASDPDAFWLRRQTATGSYLRSSLDHSAWTLTPGLGLTAGSRRFTWASAIDPVSNSLLGHSGSVSWSGQCQCWSVSITGSHELEPERVRLFVSFQLTPLHRNATTAH